MKYEIELKESVGLKENPTPKCLICSKLLTRGEFVICKECEGL